MTPGAITQRFRDTGVFIPDGDLVYPRIDVLNAVLGNITGYPEYPPVNESGGGPINEVSAASWSNSSFNYCENITIVNAAPEPRRISRCSST